LLGSLNPNKLILGTPRGLWKTIKYASDSKVDTTWVRFFEEDSSWGKKLPFERRKEIYEFFFNKLTSAGYPLSNVSLCKETVVMLQALKIDYSGRACNCYGKNAM